MTEWADAPVEQAGWPQTAGLNGIFRADVAVIDTHVSFWFVCSAAVGRGGRQRGGQPPPPRGLYRRGRVSENLWRGHARPASAQDNRLDVAVVSLASGAVVLTCDIVNTSRTVDASPPEGCQQLSPEDIDLESLDLEP